MNVSGAAEVDAVDAQAPAATAQRVAQDADGVSGGMRVFGADAASAADAVPGRSRGLLWMAPRARMLPDL